MLKILLPCLLAVMGVLFLCPAAQTFAAEVVVVKGGPSPLYDDIVKGVQEPLSGKAQVIEFGRSQGEPESALRKIKEWSPKVVIALGNTAIGQIATQLPTVPMVYCTSPSVSRKLLGDYSTGVFLGSTVRKDFASLHQVLPNVRKVGILFNRDLGASFETFKEAKTVAREYGMDIAEIPFDKDPLVSLKPIVNRIELLWVIPDRIIGDADIYQRMLGLTFDAKVPVMVFSGGRKAVELGAFMTLSPDYREVGRQLSGMAIQILNGRHPESIPAVFPNIFLRVIRPGLARKFGLTIPGDVLKDRHTEIID
ncbi:MAG: hypothetical protein HYU64_20830 [Armatimonadetes bacterium]|nr:hypothetical protein [Armatimonadota bacterium]